MATTPGEFAGGDFGHCSDGEGGRGMSPKKSRETTSPKSVARHADSHPLGVAVGQAKPVASRTRAASEGSVLRAYNPISWFHALGIYRVLARLKPRLPDVGGCLFLTFTTNPALYACPSTAFDHARDRLRRIFYALRNGVEWEGKRYVIDAPYAIKVEFHKNGWAHFHVIFLSRRYVPAALITHLWGLGRTDVRRIKNEKFHYLLKYVTKGGALPDWVLARKRLRVFQPSHGFCKPEPEDEEKEGGEKIPPPMCPKKRASYTLGERLTRWSKTALLGHGSDCEQIPLSAPFTELFNELVYSVAVAGRYLGNGEIQINDRRELIPWIIPLPALSSL